jgi:cation diffusion facilitator CzcD-associated flavoprotein CzcO
MLRLWYTQRFHTTTSKFDVTIVGGGLVGYAMATALSKSHCGR